MGFLNFILYFILALIIIAAFVYLLIYIEHERYIKGMADEYTFEFVNRMILEDETAINDCVGEAVTDFEFINDVLDHMEIWKEVRECKLKKELASEQNSDKDKESSNR